MKRLIVLVSFMLLFSGCAMTGSNPDQVAQITGTMANTMVIAKKTVISVMTSISIACQTKVLDEQTCKKAADLYGKVQPAIDAAEQSIIVAVTTGDLTQANANQAAVNGLIAEIMELKGDK